MSELKISIVTACYNSGDTLVRTIESLKSQSGCHVESIIIDGGSSDSTMEVIEKYDSFISTFVSEPDDGVYHAMNKGIALCTGDIIGILNADDFYPNSAVLKSVIKAFDDPSVDACYGDLRYVDRSDVKRCVRYWRAGKYTRQKFYRGWMPPHPTFFVRRQVYEQYGMFRLDLGSSADYELMLRLLFKHQLKAVYVPEVLVHMRTGGISNASFINRLKANYNDRKSWKVNKLRPQLWTFWLKPIRKITQWIIK